MTYDNFQTNNIPDGCLLQEGPIENKVYIVGPNSSNISAFNTHETFTKTAATTLLGSSGLHVFMQTLATVFANSPCNGCPLFDNGCRPEPYYSVIGHDDEHEKVVMKILIIPRSD
jgi:hypothetical protein